MSVTPPLQTDHNTASSDADLTAHAATSRWGTVSGGLRSPPPAPSSGAGVRRNHTIHGARHHGKPRLEKHFEQPEDYPAHQSLGDGASIAHQASQPATVSAMERAHAPSSSSPSTNHPPLDPLASSSTRSDAARDFASSLSPLQALYSKSSVSRNLSLPSRHSSKLASNLPHSATHGRTSLFNSLSAITGGSDLDEHDWEKLIHSSNALGDEHHQDPNASHSLSMQTDHPWSSSLFAQAQLGAPADASLPTSPISRSDLFADAHQRTGSSSAVDLFDQQAALSEAQALRGSASFVRRHQSLNHHSGRSAANRLAARSTDLLSRYAGDVADPVMSSYSRTDAAFSPVRHPTSLSVASSPIMPTSYSKAPWNQPAQDPIGSPSRFAASFPSQNLDGSHTRMPSGIDASSASLAELGKNLGNLDMSGSSALAAEDSLDTHASVTPTSHTMLTSLSAQSSTDSRASSARKLPQLVTNRDALQRGQRTNGTSGPLSAAAYVPPIGHAHSRHQSNDPTGSNTSTFDADPSQRFGPFTAAPAGSWMDKDNIAGRAAADSQSWAQQSTAIPYPAMGMDPNVMALSMALAQEQQRSAFLQAQLGARNNAIGMQEPHLFGMQPIDLNGPMQSIGQQLRGGPLPSSPPIGGMGNLPQRGPSFPMQPSQPPFRPPMHAQAPSPRPPPAGAPFTSGDTEGGAPPTPVDPASLALQKGYNPAPGTFDLAPPNARFFVIKSYTEDDVHKSLKYEIWASTDKGNQRLDKAFRESASDGPIYLFYSVNASGHFCGMAQMLTPLDYATSSNVWAQDGKWKGTFKVRWIYVKDLPNNQLRHIRLTNTPECKPVTQSRDTQELTPEAGREVLRIMAEYSAKTSLLQDFNFYEMQGRGSTGQGTMTAQRPLSSSPALGLGGLQPRNSPKTSGSPALGIGGMAYPTSPDLGLTARPNAASPNGGARRPPPSGTPQRLHAISGLGLAPGTSRTNNATSQQLNDLRDDKNGDTVAGSHDATVDTDAVSAAQVAGLAPSAL
ncbi:uncharacterized protein UTRI_03051 [Ustilago trichophora]|uniref:YTH domain-containing protein n=1 Tax=Ustilago trichophora TaxID=86804 RepID=A0A5C3E7X7_9BASI|nr:uncharacterized protein UTRI_03051 [Ustilago trichophora]